MPTDSKDVLTNMVVIYEDEADHWELSHASPTRIYLWRAPHNLRGVARQPSEDSLEAFKGDRVAQVFESKAEAYAYIRWAAMAKVKEWLDARDSSRD